MARHSHFRYSGPTWRWHTISDTENSSNQFTIQDESMVTGETRILSPRGCGSHRISWSQCRSMWNGQVSFWTIVWYRVDDTQDHRISGNPQLWIGNGRYASHWIYFGWVFQHCRLHYIVVCFRIVSSSISLLSNQKHGPHVPHGAQLFWIIPSSWLRLSAECLSCPAQQNAAGIAPTHCSCRTGTRICLVRRGKYSAKLW